MRGGSDSFYFAIHLRIFLTPLFALGVIAVWGMAPQPPGSAPGYAGNTEEVLGIHEVDGVEVLCFDEWLQNWDPLGTGNSYREGRERSKTCFFYKKQTR